jgi:hypothetical protein
MAQVIEFVGGPCAGQHPIDGEPPEVQTFARNPSPGEPPPVDLAAYRLDQSSGIPRYHFVGIGRQGRFRNGPLDGQEQVFLGGLPTTFEAHNTGPDGKVTAIARYALQPVDATGESVYELTEIDDLQTNEDKALAAVFQFYKEPNPGIYSIKPGLHKEVWIEVGPRRGSVDEEITGLIKAVWTRGWETIGSCQERPSDSKYAGMAYVAFPFAQQGSQFASILQAAGIEHQTREKKFGFARRNDKGEKTENGEIDALDVFFYKRDFERIVLALNF